MVVLGCAILEDKSFRAIIERLDEKDFSDKHNKRIFRVLKKEGQMDLSDIRRRRKNIPLKYLVQVVNCVPSTKDVKLYIDKLKSVNAKTGEQL